MTVREHGDIKGILGINVQENGVTQVSSADTVNIVGGATVTDTGGVATINIPEGVTWYREDVPAGSASYTFVNAPATSTSFLIFTDSGTLLFSGVDYTYDPDTETVTFLSLGANEAAYIWVAHALVTGGNIGDMVKFVYDPNNVQQNVYDYTYFINTPTIGNATLTIQKNGSDVATFGANATSNATANITVPTTVAELGDASDYAKTSDLSSYVTQSDLQTELGNYATTSDLSSKQDTLVSGTSIKTINSTSLLGSGDVTVQETLVSGTNIKTINNTSLLGSGDITISGGSGDVTGPASSTSGNLAVFDGTTGKIIKDGGAIPTGFNPGNTGTAGQFLKKTADGYEWDDDNDTTYSAGTGITITGTTIANSGVTSVNGQSGAVTISGGGTNMYDCVVASDGTGDYTTLGAALTAGKKSIYIKNGTYNESQVTVTDNDFYIQGESEGGVILNYITTSTYTYCIKFQTSTRTTLSEYIYNHVKNVTFNISVQSGNYGLNYTTIIDSSSLSNTPHYDLKIDSCTIKFIVSSTTSASITFMKVAGADLGTGAAGNGHGLIENCTIILENATGVNADTIVYDDTLNDSVRCYVRGCKIYNINTSSGMCFWQSGSITYEGCEVFMSSRQGTGKTDIRMIDFINCNVYCNANSTGRAYGEIDKCRGCYLSLTNGPALPSGFNGTTVVTKWATGVAYNVGDYVTQLGDYLFKCTTAHTSGDTFDYDNWETIGGFRIGSIEGCAISAGSGMLGIMTLAKVVGNDISAQYMFSAGENTIITGNTISSTSMIKIAGEGQIFTDNMTSGYSSNTSGKHGIYYSDDYNIIKDNMLKGNSEFLLIGATTNTSKVSDNIAYNS